MATPDPYGKDGTPVQQDIPIDRIDTTGGTQMRCRIDDDTVADYRAAMIDGADFPAVVVFAEGKKYWLADGFHRYRARLSIGARDIRCEVHVGDRFDAIAYAVGANKTNGLRRTNADKQMAVRAALSLERLASWSDRAIAELVGVDGKTVAAMRAPAGAEIPQLTPNRVKGKDGKSYPAPKSQTPRVAARGDDRPSKPDRVDSENLRLASGPVNQKDDTHGAASSTKRAVLLAGESHVCPHCHGTGRIRGSK